MPSETELPGTKAEDREDRSDSEQASEVETDDTPGESPPPKPAIFSLLSEVLDSLLPRLRALTGTGAMLPEGSVESLQEFFGPFWESVETWARQWSQSGSVLPGPAEAGDGGNVPEPVSVEEDPTALAPAELAPEAVDVVFAQYAA